MIMQVFRLGESLYCGFRESTHIVYLNQSITYVDVMYYYVCVNKYICIFMSLNKAIV